MKKIALAFLLIGILCIGYLLVPRNHIRDTQLPPASQAIEYVKAHISELAPEKEQVGGTYFVTHIEAAEGKGTVAYEDGHNAYTADFTYAANDAGTTKITSFVLKEE